VDHKIRYKGADLPYSLQRRLSRLSALLEVADEQFAALQAASETVRESYAESLARGDLDVELDAISLTTFLDQSDFATRWADRAVALGYGRWIHVAPTEKQVENLLHAMEADGIADLETLQRRLESADEWGEAALEAIFERTEARDPAAERIWAVPVDMLTLLLLFHAEDDAAVDGSLFNPRIKSGIKAAYAA
jgi:putative GTP pyrophosphokinase